MKSIVIFLHLLITFSCFSQGPWTQEKGKFYTQVSFTTIPSYDTLFGNPDYNINGQISDNTIQLYGEYGISNKTTLIVNLPYKLITLNENNIKNTVNKLGNIEFGLKHNFYNKDWLLSGLFTIEANTSSYNEISRIRTGYDAWSFTSLFLAGKSFGKNYLQAFVGANIRTNNYSSNFKIGGEFGGKVGNKIWLIGFLDISKVFKEGYFRRGELSPKTFSPVTGLYVTDQEYGVVGAKVIGEFSDNFGITASLPAAFFGNNVPKQLALSVGLYHKF